MKTTFTFPKPTLRPGYSKRELWFMFEFYKTTPKGVLHQGRNLAAEAWKRFRGWKVVS